MTEQEKFEATELYDDEFVSLCLAYKHILQLKQDFRGMAERFCGKTGQPVDAIRDMMEGCEWMDDELFSFLDENDFRERERGTEDGEDQCEREGSCRV